MREVIIFEDAGFKNLLPLVWWRGVFELRCGRTSLLEKITAQIKLPLSLFVREQLADVLRERFRCPVNPSITGKKDVLLVNGRCLIKSALPELPENTILMKEKTPAVIRLALSDGETLSAKDLLQQNIAHLPIFSKCSIMQADESIVLMNYPWDLVFHNKDQLIRECADDEKSGFVYNGAHLLNEKHIHIGTGTTVKPGTVIDAEDGPVWIDNHVRISPNVVVQGPCYIGPGCLIQSSAHVREGTSLGPVCKVGGEIEDTIIQGYSNKQHYGFLGHSYLGEWINLGAGATNSDLKNTYGHIRTSLDGKTQIDTGMIFVGLTMGDHTKVGINVCFPTGAVVGTVSSVITSTYSPKFVPSFSWITDEGKKEYRLEDAIMTAERSMARRKITPSPAMIKLFHTIAELSAQFEVK
jgi:UDP-N-acetylglucosamine diphosphorylase/glucosamine-1-phosphate N-acetyltransferase